MRMQDMAAPKDPNDEIFRRNLVGFRDDANLSQADAAELSGVAIDNLRRYESGKTAKVPSDVLSKLAKVYGHTVEDFYLPNPPKAKLEERPVFFLRTLPGAKIDQKVFAELLAVIEKANRDTRKTKK